MDNDLFYMVHDAIVYDEDNYDQNYEGYTDEEVVSELFDLHPELRNDSFDDVLRIVRAIRPHR